MAHVGEYGIFGYLLARAISGSVSNKSRFWISGLAVVLGVLWALTDEFHQAFVPGREASWTDFLADGVGIVTAQVAFWSKRRVFQRPGAG